MRLAPQSEVVPASPALRRLRGDVVRSEDLTSLSTDQVRPQERLDYWREMVLRMFADVEITSHVDQGFHGHMRTRFVDGVRFTVVDAASQGVARRHPEAREHYEDCYFAVLMLAGSQWLEQDGRQVLLRPGDFAFYDGARPHSLTFSRHWGELILNIPRPLLDRELGGAGGLTATRAVCDRGAGALLRGHLAGLAQELGALDRDDLARLSRSTLGLIAAAMAHAGGRVEVRGRDQTLIRAKALVERSLDDPSLDAPRIAAALGISTRYLNKLFEAEHTSLMRFVLARRLERCRDDLLDPACSAHSVSDIALRWGFNDLSHFSRVFRARFGESPRECRRVVGRGGAGSRPTGA
jgi:AraC family transcriptional activator of tynA and feaB